MTWRQLKSPIAPASTAVRSASASWKPRIGTCEEDEGGEEEIIHSNAAEEQAQIVEKKNLVLLPQVTGLALTA